MSRKEAYQLAQSRGYTGFISNLGRDIQSGADNNYGLAMIPLEERRKGGQARNFVDVGKG